MYMDPWACRMQSGVPYSIPPSLPASALWSLANEGCVPKILGLSSLSQPGLTVCLPGTKSQAGAAVFHPFPDKLYFYHGDL